MRPVTIPVNVEVEGEADYKGKNGMKKFFQACLRIKSSF